MHRPKKIHQLIIACVFFACAIPVHAENEKKKSQDQPLTSVTFIGIGPRPVKRFREMNATDIDPADERAEKMKHVFKRKLLPKIPQPPLPDTVPPSTLYYKTSAKKWLRVSVGFNTSSRKIKIPANIPVQLHKLNEAGKYERYLNVPPLRPESQSLVFLLPSKTGAKRWGNEPKLQIVDCTSESFSDKDVLIKNFSSHSIACLLGKGEPMFLKPGVSKSIKTSHIEGYYRVAAMTDKKIPLINTSIRANSKNLTIIVFYNANLKTNVNIPVSAFRIIVNKMSLKDNTTRP